MRHLTLLMLALLLAGGCEKRTPENKSSGESEKQTAPSADAPDDVPSVAEQAIEQTHEPAYEPEGGIYAPIDYLSEVLKTPGQAKLVVSQSNMRTLGQAMTMHKMTQGGYPDSMAALVEAGGVPAGIMRSPGNEAAQIVYLKPTDRPASSALLAFDPVGYAGNKFVIVTCGGGSSTMGLDELKAAIRAREGKVVQPELKLGN